ncbi:hypothetical protein M422DRAFT_251515 [Sphaerobolus stellatus SS14]|uniref:Uncharacterized protein n=1 Tax=Sphaerobolus stellatus (strain SS14) TaxID=990650 RepID=A0A0C9W1Q9_SPHS4|nr:hypothetical protein M422DRAFT_251515 [Sphaerobolus stellatus SS14]
MSHRDDYQDRDDFYDDRAGGYNDSSQAYYTDETKEDRRESRKSCRDERGGNERRGEQRRPEEHHESRMSGSVSRDTAQGHPKVIPPSNLFGQSLRVPSAARASGSGTRPVAPFPAKFSENVNSGGAGHFIPPAQEVGGDLLSQLGSLTAMGNLNSPEIKNQINKFLEYFTLQIMIMLTNAMAQSLNSLPIVDHKPSTSQGFGAFKVEEGFKFSLALNESIKTFGQVTSAAIAPQPNRQGNLGFSTGTKNQGGGRQEGTELQTSNGKGKEKATEVANEDEEDL